MILRCKIDDLLLFAHRHPRDRVLVAYDGDESFYMERVEAMYYELVAATRDEAAWLEMAGYRLLKQSANFGCLASRRLA